MSSWDIDFQAFDVRPPTAATVTKTPRRTPCAPWEAAFWAWLARWRPRADLAAGELRPVFPVGEGQVALALPQPEEATPPLLPERAEEVGEAEVM